MEPCDKNCPTELFSPYRVSILIFKTCISEALRLLRIAKENFDKRYNDTMAKKRSKRKTHVGANNPTTPAEINGHASAKDPKSMVIRIGAGEVGSTISQLAADVRRVMEPGTASRLKERRANRLRDYVTMCGPLGVTHLLLFSRSESGNANLRLVVAPRGPTFHFRIEKYSLSKDVRRAQRHPKGGGKEYITPPLVRYNACPTNRR